MNQSFWQSPFKGLELAFNFGRYATYINLSLGLGVFFLSRVLATLYFMNNVDDESILERARKKLLPNAGLFLIFFLFFLINVLIASGFNYDPVTKVINMESFKYLNNLLAMPVVLIILLLGVAMSYVSLMVPFVVAYIWHAWKSLNNTPITQKEMEEDSHAY